MKVNYPYCSEKKLKEVEKGFADLGRRHAHYKHEIRKGMLECALGGFVMFCFVIVFATLTLAQ